ncbi:hypothetical protein G7054_g4971 [Neopestalotiopsis clavispora]|nr:hypothetical protein G7054_g4971 [Neopestalotiopsis clavispora]
MPSDYQASDPGWDGQYNHGETQDDSACYPYPDDMTNDTMDGDAYHGSSYDPSAFPLDPPIEGDYRFRVLDSHINNDAYQEGYGAYPAFDSPGHALEDVEYSEPPVPPATWSGTSNSDFFFGRTDTLSTITSIEPHQGSADGSSDGEDGGRQPRRRDPEELNDAFSRFDPPQPVGSRYAYRSISDVASSRIPEQTSKKKEKRGKYKETSSSYNPLSSSGNKKKRRDHDDRDTSGQRWNNEV